LIDWSLLNTTCAIFYKNNSIFHTSGSGNKIHLIFRSWCNGVQRDD
jgi:hypothetical protein